MNLAPAEQRSTDAWFLPRSEWWLSVWQARLIALLPQKLFGENERYCLPTMVISHHVYQVLSECLGVCICQPLLLRRGGQSPWATQRKDRLLWRSQRLKVCHSDGLSLQIWPWSLYRHLKQVNIWDKNNCRLVSVLNSPGLFWIFKKIFLTKYFWNNFYCLRF